MWLGLESSRNPHQYIVRGSNRIQNEALVYDKAVRCLYSTAREHSPTVFKWLTRSAKATDLLAKINFDRPVVKSPAEFEDLKEKMHLSLEDALDEISYISSWREVFGRKIKFWETRPVAKESAGALCPADARVLVGYDHLFTQLRIKNKLFSRAELVGTTSSWSRFFQNADWAIFRLTPDKYHFNHMPVSGIVRAQYDLEGYYHSCNPSVAAHEFQATSKNHRAVTIVDTDVKDGSNIGLVAIVEVAALLVGRIHQCYSDIKYESPRLISAGDFVRMGAVKSCFEPGSSTVVLLFQSGRASFAKDLVVNQGRTDVLSRFTSIYGFPMVETDVLVRSMLATAKT